MLSRFARLLLVLTSLAPMVLVYGATLLPDSSALGWFAAAALIASACFGLIAFARRNGEREVLEVERTEMQDREVLTFIVSYLLPVIKPTSLSWAGFWTFAALVVIVLYQAEVLNVNPLLGLAGFHFHKTITKSGATYLVLTRRNAATLRGQLTAVRLTTHVWLEL